MLGKQEGFRNRISQTREEVHHSTQSANLPVRSQGECYPRVLFDQDNKPQNPRQDSGKIHPKNRRNQPRQSEQYPIAKQECTCQRIRDQVEINTQITHSLQAEEHAKKQG